MNPLNELKHVFTTTQDKWGTVIEVGADLKVAVEGKIQQFPYLSGFQVGDSVIVRSDGRIEKRLLGVSSYEV